MGTKDNPSKFDCYAKLESNEPYFVLMGRDPCAANAVNYWVDDRIIMLRKKYNDNMPEHETQQLAEARNCAIYMSDYAYMWKHRKVEPRLDYLLYQDHNKYLSVIINDSQTITMTDLVAFYLEHKK